MIPAGGPSSQPIPSQFREVGYGLPWFKAQSYGGVALNDTSKPLNFQVWQLEYDNTTGAATLTSSITGHSSVVLTRPDITELSLAFDQNMRLFIAFVQAGQAKFYWYDPIAEAMVFDEATLGAATNPRCTLDDKRSTQIPVSDIVLAYVRAGSLYYRSQQDRYTVEYLWLTGVSELLFVGMAAGRLQFAYKGVGQPTPPFLGDVVMDLCGKAGIARSNIDTTELYDDVVQGLGVETTEGLTEPVDQLRDVFFFDKSEYDKKLHFPKRGRDVVARIPYKDLVRGNPVALKQERRDEADLAREVHLNHIDPDGGFAKNKQFARRRSNLINAQGKNNVDTQVVLTVDQAASAADTLLRIDWNEIVEYKFTTTIKYTALTTGDVIEVEDKLGTWHRMRIEEKNEDSTIEWEAVKDAGQRTYGSARTGNTLPPPVSTAPGLVGETQIEIINVSPLRDQDDELGLYIAAAGVPNMAWTGYQLLVSVDGGTSYAEAFRGEVPSTIGLSTTDLINEGGYDIPSAEEVEVTCNFPLSSIDAGQVATGQNRFCIGDEIGQFETATLLGMVGTLYHYKLSGLHRARYGTVADFWPAGTRFVLIDETVSFVQAQRAMLGVDLHYKPVSYGQTEDDTIPTAYLFDEPASQTEWVPANVAASRDGVSNDVTVTFDGRPRMGQFGTPFHSKYFRGYKVKFSDSHTITTMAETVVYPNAPVGVTVQVCGVNEITGDGPFSAAVST